jgi:catechol 2,3-dioxygenase
MIVCPAYPAIYLMLNASHRAPACINARLKKEPHMKAHPHFADIRPEKPIGPGVRIGHVHLKVADIERSLKFYIGMLGFELITIYGSQAAFISAGGYHHHIALNTWESLGASPPPAGTTGLYHLAILYPTRAELADALQRVEAAGIKLDGASDHGVSEALYLRDPDQNGVELYWDRPLAEWPRDEEGRIAMSTHRLNLDSLRAEIAPRA